jgi:hypothetical protein
MTNRDTELLLRNTDKTVRIRCKDGEVILAKIDTVSVDEGEVVFELVSTTDEKKYEKYDEQPAYLMHFHEIATVEEIEGSVDRGT